MSVSTAADKCVSDILASFRDSFNGLKADEISEFQKILTPRIRIFGEKIHLEATNSANGVPTKVPKLKRVSNYTMFGNDFRAKNKGKIAVKEMFSHIAKAWESVSAKDKASWTEKANAQNETYRQAYIAEHGSLPSTGKVRTRPKSTTAFQQFVSEFRNKNKTVKHTEVFGKASEEWKKMTPKQKKKFEDQAEKLKSEYKEEWARYTAEHPEVLEQAAKGKRRKVKEGERPKKKTGYMLYGVHFREKLNKNKLTGREAMTAIGEAWNKLSPKEQEKYNNQATEANKGIVDAFVKQFPDSKWSRAHSSPTAGGVVVASS